MIYTETDTSKMIFRWLILKQTTNYKHKLIGVLSIKEFRQIPVTNLQIPHFLMASARQTRTVGMAWGNLSEWHLLVYSVFNKGNNGYLLIFTGIQALWLVSSTLQLLLITWASIYLGKKIQSYKEIIKNKKNIKFS